MGWSCVSLFLSVVLLYDCRWIYVDRGGSSKVIFPFISTSGANYYHFTPAIFMRSKYFRVEGKFIVENKTDLLTKLISYTN